MATLTKNQRPLKQIKCPHCKDWFVPWRRTVVVYCSRWCRQEANNDRRRKMYRRPCAFCLVNLARRKFCSDECSDSAQLVQSRIRTMEKQTRRKEWENTS